MQPARNGYDWNPDPLHCGYDGRHFVGPSALGEDDEHVSGGHHPEVAVQTLGRMQEERRRARACESRCQLSADRSGLPHSRDNDSARAVQDQLHCTAKALIDPVRQGLYGGCFYGDGLFRLRQCLC